MTIKAVIFDLGGTLIHYHDPQNDPARPFYRMTMAGIGNLLARLQQEGNHLPSRDELGPIFDRHIGESYREAIREMRGGSIETPIRAALAEAGVGLSDAEWEALRPVYYCVIDEAASPRAGLAETIRALHEAGYALGIISNTFWAADLHDRHLAEQGVLDYFPVRIYSCDNPHMKPHPAIFADALAQIGVAAGEAVYVGDRGVIDVGAAQKVGMRGVLIRSPYLPDEPGEVVPDAIVDELPDLPNALETLQQEAG
jgi:HAD superfamily hydrolase (TIGR01509 family)